jgi:hypothetical protein
MSTLRCVVLGLIVAFILQSFASATPPPNVTFQQGPAGCIDTRVSSPGGSVAVVMTWGSGGGAPPNPKATYTVNGGAGNPSGFPTGYLKGNADAIPATWTSDGGTPPTYTMNLTGPWNIGPGSGVDAGDHFDYYIDITQGTKGVNRFYATWTFCIYVCPP